uniref:Uncharacterized protein n=1 Tax=Meloidogyne enterolobii TaxID=390850 RepID=A0A6V7THL7_MELEN|nr:unnamed protein product [Meloidogyne enterolobii]
MEGVAHPLFGHIIPGSDYTDRNPTYSHAPNMEVHLTRFLNTPTLI